jgi:hypothetical protein
MTVRLAVNINDDTAEYLKERAKRKGTSVTEQVRMLASVGAFMDQLLDGGNTIQTVKPDGSTQTWVVVW